MLKEDNLPIHLEAGALAQDPSDAGALYAVYSLVPYSEVWRSAVVARNLLRRTNPSALPAVLIATIPITRSQICECLVSNKSHRLRNLLSSGNAAILA
jgi:hypothetical protein